MMKTQTTGGAFAALTLIVLASIGATSAFADDDHIRAAISHPAYSNECGSCHIAFPPGLLAADSWRALMTGLDKHFGSDASLDVATTREIETFLTANASPRKTLSANGQPLIRITETSWFLKEHREGHEGLCARIFQSGAAKSAANCSACHREAIDGDYSERNIRVPR
jgi:hypothetical protein